MAYGRSYVKARGTNNSSYRSYSARSKSDRFAKTQKARQTIAVTKIQSAYRKKRAGGRTAANRAAIYSNARAISRLKSESYGAVQQQVSTLLAVPRIRDNYPIAIHVNNVTSGLNSGKTWCVEDVGGTGLGRHVVQKTSSYFNKWAGTEVANYHEMDQEETPGNLVSTKMKLLSVDFQIKFSGFMKDTRIRVDVVRQKRVFTAFWSDDSSVAQYLPHTLRGFEGLAGFGPNHIDKDTFQVLQTKYVYLNSAPSHNLEDATQDRRTADPTTAPTKYCHVHVPINKKLCLIDTNYASSHFEENFSFNNMSPLHNIWLLISCDDGSSLPENVTDIVTGDYLTTEIIRTCKWRDPYSKTTCL